MDLPCNGRRRSLASPLPGSRTSQEDVGMSGRYHRWRKRVATWNTPSTRSVRPNKRLPRTKRGISSLQRKGEGRRSKDESGGSLPTTTEDGPLCYSPERDPRFRALSTSVERASGAAFPLRWGRV